MKKLLPWNLRTTDFSKPGLHAEPTFAFELMFEFLRLSPSYELARQISEGKVKAAEKGLPEDFDKVLVTYKLLGNVQKTLFRQWWIKRGLKAFGNPHDKPSVHKISDLHAGLELQLEDVSAPLTEYLLENRKSEGLAQAILIAVPVQLKRADLIKQITTIVDQAKRLNDQSNSQPILKLHGKRLRKRELINGLRLLWFRAAKPHWEYWRLGTYSKFSKTYAEALDHKNERKTRSTLESYDREMMTKLIGRALKKYEAIAENAARGKFPCADQVEIMAFEYPKLAKRMQEKNAWERFEKERLRSGL
jgi:hypothetical protein